MPTPEETAAALEQKRTELLAAEAAHADAIAAAEEAKTPEQTIMDLLEGLVMRLGNRPDLRVLLNRLRARLNAAPIAPAPAPAEASGSSETKAS